MGPEQVSRDHSVVQEVVDNGPIEPLRQAMSKRFDDHPVSALALAGQPQDVQEQIGTALTRVS